MIVLELSLDDIDIDSGPRHRLAATKMLLITIQQGYEFRNHVYVDERSFHWTSFKALSTSATFVFTMDALLDHFLSATIPTSWNRCSKCVIIDAFDDVSPEYFC
ncbi:hypothetical protein TNCV_1348041 [Trichonephila clavipes]|nr:hypothetical protein TNCV_1348041 [Trichonephila clavipes]